MKLMGENNSIKKEGDGGGFKIKEKADVHIEEDENNNSNIESKELSPADENK
jgi:hypothetical protein